VVAASFKVTRAAEVFIIDLRTLSVAHRGPVHDKLASKERMTSSTGLRGINFYSGT
jgi:hypothetical protein